MSGSSPDILHLATHGFYYTPTDAHKARALSGYDDIMYLTGVVMSGGNAEWQGQELPDGVLGGLLTSEDISHTDLSKTNLVVLSACDTGRGEATNEGLFGLQRAFKKAGVQTIVMSLWQVSDMVTQEFMVEFYRCLASSHWDKRKAFDQARTEIKQRYPEPFYWAGFIMID
jgi:CHAT domain-containing protein